MSIRLIINDTEINLNKGAYKEVPKVKETRNETEAGTTHRDILRTGIRRPSSTNVQTLRRSPSSSGRRERAT